MSFTRAKSVPYLQVLIGSWFALGLLVVLALGVGLIGVLHFWGPWLEENWNLTFPSPLSTSMWWWFLLIPLGILLLYFLKLKRRALHVPSTFLWKKSIEDLHVNSLFQWLRRNLLLILQLLGLMGIGYALADPTYNSEAKGRHIILMLDNSASMAATDETPTRLERAKQLAHERIDSLDPTDQGMVISFSSEAQILQSYTNRKEDLHRAVDRIEQTHRPTNFEPALALAEGQANPRRTAEEAGVAQPAAGEAMPRSMGAVEGVPTDVYVFSDGRFPDVPDFTLGKLTLRFQPVGSSANNIGIGRLAMKRDEERADQLDVDVHVKNFSSQPVAGKLDVVLEVYAGGARQDRKLWPNGVSLAARKVQETAGGPEGQKKQTIVPGDTTPQPILSFSIKDPGPGYVKVSLLDRTSGQPWRDDFALDDVAWLAITPVRKARVLRIGPPNDILDAFLAASIALQRAEVTELPGTDPSLQPKYREAIEGEAYDLVIFDRCAPTTMADMPQANTFFLGQVPPLREGLWESMKKLQNAYAIEFTHTHPFMRGIETLQGMVIQDARAFPKEIIPARASALLETQLEPVMWALGRQRYTDLVLTFPLVVEEPGARGPVWNTNWPKQPAGTLPLFLDNVLTKLGRFKEYEEPHKPGVPKVLEPGEAISVVQIVHADAVADPLRPERPRPEPETLRREVGKELIYGPPNLVGLYDVSWAERVRYRFAVNLFDAPESLIEPRQALWVGEDQVSQSQEPVKKRQELWPWFVLAALLILLVEWVVYNRRISV